VLKALYDEDIVPEPLILAWCAGFFRVSASLPVSAVCGWRRMMKTLCPSR